MEVLKVLSFLILISCSNSSKKEEITIKSKNVEKEIQRTEVQRIELTKFYLLVHFYNESHGSVFVNGLPILYRSQEDTKSGTKSKSSQISIGDFLINGTNTIQLSGDFKKYEIGVYQPKIGQFIDEGIKIELKEEKPAFFTFEIDGIDHRLWDDTEDFEASDHKNFAEFVSQVDQMIKKGLTDKYLKINQIKMQKLLKEKNSNGLLVSMKDIETDIQESFQTIREGKEYAPIDIPENEVTYHISNSKKLAMITHKNKPYLTGFTNNEYNNDVWGWKILYMKKGGKFIPIVGF